MKSAKGGSMGSKVAKGAGAVEKAIDTTKAAGSKIKESALKKLPKAT